MSLPTPLPSPRSPFFPLGRSRFFSVFFFLLVLVSLRPLFRTPGIRGRGNISEYFTGFRALNRYRSRCSVQVSRREKKAGRRKGTTENPGCVHRASGSWDVSFDIRGVESQMSKSNSARYRGDERFLYRTDQVERIFEEFSFLEVRIYHIHTYIYVLEGILDTLFVEGNTFLSDGAGNSLVKRFYVRAVSRSPELFKRFREQGTARSRV